MIILDRNRFIDDLRKPLIDERDGLNSLLLTLTSQDTTLLSDDVDKDSDLKAIRSRIEGITWSINRITTNYNKLAWGGKYDTVSHQSWLYRFLLKILLKMHNRI